MSIDQTCVYAILWNGMCVGGGVYKKKLFLSTCALSITLAVTLLAGLISFISFQKCVLLERHLPSSSRYGPRRLLASRLKANSQVIASFEPATPRSQVHDLTTRQREPLFCNYVSYDINNIGSGYTCVIVVIILRYNGIFILGVMSQTHNILIYSI